MATAQMSFLVVRPRPTRTQSLLHPSNRKAGAEARSGCPGSPHLGRHGQLLSKDPPGPVGRGRSFSKQFPKAEVVGLGRERANTEGRQKGGSGVPLLPQDFVIQPSSKTGAGSSLLQMRGDKGVNPYCYGVCAPPASASFQPLPERGFQER